MRAGVLLTAILVIVVFVAAVREVHLSREREKLRQTNQQLNSQQDRFNERLEKAEAKAAQRENETSTGLAPSSQIPNPETQKRIADLESRVRTLQTALNRQPTGPIVPEYDPTNPPLETEPETNAPPKRSWGTEQLLGPPDTAHAGDAPTAWASLEQNAGPEWLTVGFDRAVDLAQVRIRETYNPGAISKVTAVINGAEVVLWEGTSARGKAPRDFVVPVSGSVQANSVVVHLDTTRVPGWNEIDAVELVGRDGSRQWATSSSASSTYAEQTRSAQPQSFQP